MQTRNQGRISALALMNGAQDTRRIRMTQKITIEPVTRIEGHAKVTIHMREDGSVDRAYMHVNEFRGFEKFCEGRL